jgi:uncharacterized tellurite resistance protein B-like protein
MVETWFNHWRKSIMRTYPANSPQAVARILALVMVADGNVSKAELDAIERFGAYEQVGLERNVMPAVLQTLCEDLLQARHPYWANACQVDAQTLEELLAEIEDPELRATVHRLCVAVAAADNHVADGELVVLASAAAQWGVGQETMSAPPSKPH